MADRGRYAVESAGSSRWDPETSSEVAQAARVREFREQYHLLDDADFAFAFRSAEEALLAGGRGLADAWTKARSEQTEELMPLAASTVEAGSSRDRPAHALHLPAPPVPVRKGVTLSQQAFSADSVNRRVEALAKVFEDAGIHRPSVGNLSDAILAEWKLQLTRLAQVKVTKSEPQTVVNAVRTWSELVSFMRSRDRTTIEHLDLASFLASGSKGPKRALNSLRWLNKLGHLGWQLDAIVLDPPASRRAAARSQALVVEPPMLTHLERGIKEAFTRQDPRWTAMLGSWIVGVGVLRYRHVQRAQMVRLSRSTMYCHCPKGKQASKRDGFDFSIPSQFTDGWPWAEHVVALRNQLPEAQRDEGGLCFNREGRAWDISEVQAAGRELFQDLVTDVADLSTYSWRRLMPTVALLAKYTPVEMVALGDWQSKSELPQEAAMPTHYAGSRDLVSMRLKHLSLGLVARLGEFDAWELATPAAITAAVDAAKPEVQRAVSLDKHSLWDKPMSVAAAQRAFAFSRERAALTRAAQASSKRSEAVMPPSINGKVVTRFLRNGKALCPNFQLDACHVGEGTCGEAHLCAIVLKTGRACGGKHPAQACLAKRYVVAEDVEHTPLANVAVPSTAEPVALPVADAPEAPHRASSPESTSSEDESSAGPRSPSASPSPVPAPKTKKLRTVPPPDTEAVPSPAQPVAPKAMPPSVAATAAAPKASEVIPPWRAAAAEATEAPSDIFEMPEPPAAFTPNVHDQRWDRLATVRGKSAQAPTKVLSVQSGGTLWLGGLPTNRSASAFPSVTLQVACMLEEPSQRGGICLQGATLRKFAIAHPDRRDEQWRDLFPLLCNTLWGGEDVLLHCISGRHRAAGTACMIRAILLRERFEAAWDYLASVRDVDIQGLLRDRALAGWIHETLRTSSLGNAWPRPTGYIATARSQLHIQGYEDTPLCSHRQSGQKSKGRLANPSKCTSKMEAIAWGRPTCQVCANRAPASWIP